MTSFSTLTSRVGLTVSAGDGPAVSHSHTTRHFLDHGDLQQLAMEILPVRMPDKIRTECLKCSVKFSPPFVARHHCRCCGDIFCAKCSGTKMRLALPSPEYAEDVRVCDYCFTHLCQGDKNSILRYLGVLRSSEVDCVDKLNAARALHMSIEFEPLAPDPPIGYPHFYTAVRQFGGFNSLWQIIKSISDDASSPSELSCLMCRLVSSTFARLSPRDLDSAKMFYCLDGVSMLVRCLQDGDCVESAAEALTHVVSKVNHSQKTAP